MKQILMMLILIFASYNILAQNTLNYSVNSTSGSNKIDSISINYVIGEPIAVASYLITIPLANLVDSFDNIYQYDNYYFKMFPNPTTDYLIISLPISDNYNIDLLDNTGKVVGNIYSDKIISDVDYCLSIEHFNLSTGSYYIHIQSKKINTLLHFIMQK